MGGGGGKVIASQHRQLSRGTPSYGLYRYVCLKGCGFFSPVGQKEGTILASLVSNKVWFCTLVLNWVGSLEAIVPE